MAAPLHAVYVSLLQHSCGSQGALFTHLGVEFRPDADRVDSGSSCYSLLCLTSRHTYATFASHPPCAGWAAMECMSLQKMWFSKVIPKRAGCQRKTPKMRIQDEPFHDKTSAQTYVTSIQRGAHQFPITLSPPAHAAQPRAGCYAARCCVRYCGGRPPWRTCQKSPSRGCILVHAQHKYS
eukprot:363314-Chlamydomonas_euryale.AAC.6